MRLNRSILIRSVLLISLIASLTVLSSRLQADTGSCGGVTVTLPFTDVMASPFFCQIAQAFFTGLTNGTSATTYTPGANVTREQMAAFITRTLDESIKRNNKRAALKKWYVPQLDSTFGLTTVGDSPRGLESDGEDIWVANNSSGTVSRVRASDGKLLETWTGATGAYGVLIAKGRVFITGNTSPGKLYMLDPSQPSGQVTTVVDNLDNNPTLVTFDGSKIWIMHAAPSVSKLSIIIPVSWTVATVAATSVPLSGIVFDGTNMWVTDGEVFIGGNSGHLYRLDGNGNAIQTISFDGFPMSPIFDGTNIWLPCDNHSPFTPKLIVVRATGTLRGTIIASLPFSGFPAQATAFDGERILVVASSGLFLYKATDFALLASVSSPGGQILGACSDGTNFWITSGFNKIARF